MRFYSTTVLYSEGLELLAVREGWDREAMTTKATRGFPREFHMIISVNELSTKNTREPPKESEERTIVKQIWKKKGSW